MAKVYVSSTFIDLEEERRVVIEWLVAAGHQPFHSYRPNSETVRESCLQDVDGCDLYVLILGHRYGFQPDDNNPGKLSITHLEFRRAVERHIPQIALLRTNVPDIKLSDLLDAKKSALWQGFDREVRKAVRPAEFSDDAGLIQGLSTGVQSELEKKSGKPDVAVDNRVLTIVANLTDELARKDRRIGELEEQLRAAVSRTIQAAEKPGAGRDAIAAVAALEAGDTKPAAALLGRKENQEAGRIGTPGVDDAAQRREAAALAREQGALAMGRNIKAALTAYKRAAEYEPEDIWTHLFIGDLHVLLGNLKAAKQSFERAKSLVEALVERDAAYSGWQRDLSVCHNRIGNVLLKQGDDSGALTAYQTGLKITEALAARDSANAVWQEDLSLSHEKIGDMLLARGDNQDALVSHRKSLEIREALIKRDPANSRWQGNLAVSREKIGDVMVAQNDNPGALAAHRESLKIREALAARDPANTLWQRALSVCQNKLGDMLRVQNDAPGALAAYRKGLVIIEALATGDSANTEWQRDLSVSHGRIGIVLEAQDDIPGAVASYRKSLDINEMLVELDPANVQWHTDVVFGCSKLGTLGQDRTPEERCRYLRRGREILLELKKQNRLNPQQDSIAWFDQQLTNCSANKS